MTSSNDPKNQFFYQNTPQEKYQSDQDVLNVDFDQLSTSFISSVDNIRSHFNALVPGSQELNTPQYQESRCHAFYRMIGFPVVSDKNNYYSPGYDPNLNLDKNSLASYQKILTAISNNLSITSQFSKREQIPLNYKNIFSNGDTVSQYVGLGGLFIRHFNTQLGETDPLVFDQNAIQNIDERVSEIIKIFGSSVISSNLTSNHILKPFTVDPRIDSTIRPIRNKICAPFLLDKSQTKIFQSQNGSGDSLKRPYIERVISTRFNNNNITLNNGNNIITSLIANINSNKNITDKELLNTSSNSLGQFSSEAVIFTNYIKIIQIIIEKLADSVKQIQYIRQRINFQPVPNTKGGPEAGGSINSIDPNDTNNKRTETDIIFLTQKKTINDLSFDTGLEGIPDPGDFAFSNIEDSVFSIDKNIQKTYDDNLNNLADIRNQLGTDGIEYLKYIEIIMGEFSGIGLIDMIAIQSALWLMDPSSLLGMIDNRAFSRISHRKDINLGNFTQNDIFSSLVNFEQTLKNIYLYIQYYFDGLNNGTVYSS